MKMLLALFTLAYVSAASAAEDVVATHVVPPVETNAPVPSRDLSLSLSLPAREVVRLAEASMDEAVILAFIQASAAQFDLSADDIIYLKDLGLTPPLIAAMIERDAALETDASQTSIAANQPLAAAEAGAAAAPPATAYVTNAPPQVAHFYDALAPYGAWVEVDGIGWCWQPRVVVIDRAWRPYSDGGRWIYTEAGWYWYSDYTWGWAPFHYGRWHMHPRSGWLWVPDLVWGPAWVSWRYSDLYCGWAPLPFGASFVAGHGFYFHGARVNVNFDFHLGINLFTFMEIGHFHNHPPRLHRLPPARVAEVYRHTTVINNYVFERNQTVVNHGVPVGRVAAASRREIRPIQIREARPPAEGRIGRERLDSSDKTPVLYRPQLPAARAAVTRAQRIDPQRPAIAHAPIVSRERRTTVARPDPSSPRTPAIRPQPQVTRPQAETLPGRPQAAPARPGVQPQAAPGSVRPRHAPSTSQPSLRTESPRGREQRLSTGRDMRQVPSAPARPAQPSTAPRARGQQTTPHR